MTATPEQLHLMLYDGAIRFVKQGIEGIRNENWEEAFNGLTRAQKIILEMTSSLNYDVDTELCTRMAGLYNYIYKKLVDASVQRSVDIAVEALEMIQYQRQTWVMLIEKLRQERSGDAPVSITPTSKPAVAQRQPAMQAAGSDTYGSLSVEG